MLTQIAIRDGVWPPLKRRLDLATVASAAVSVVHGAESCMSWHHLSKMRGIDSIQAWGMQAGQDSMFVELSSAGVNPV